MVPGRLRLKTYSAFKQDFRWVFTLGLALSSAVDILITGSLFGLLHTSRSDAENLKAVIDSLILYTFETGSLTCAATIIDMACWITMSSNLIFMGLHFFLGKRTSGGYSYHTGQENSAFAWCVDAFICVSLGFGCVHLRLYRCVFIVMSA
ncbi:hypothetical protein ARMSODRAFT_1025688 [Armillaria solidipes]|uniref:DUF6534 domain-containing protein n=1 Tax=Armillaria solidipes TaxID=1076256 RepID=A0A2H3BE94_9AGAR|nr:hypothetical protein ARMSODRAFT_1025688 [Armillaria solidipes]